MTLRSRPIVQQNTNRKELNVNKKLVYNHLFRDSLYQEHKFIKLLLLIIIIIIKYYKVL